MGQKLVKKVLTGIQNIGRIKKFLRQVKTNYQINLLFRELSSEAIDEQ